MKNRCSITSHKLEVCQRSAFYVALSTFNALLLSLAATLLLRFTLLLCCHSYPRFYCSSNYGRHCLRYCWDGLKFRIFFKIPKNLAVGTIRCTWIMHGSCCDAQNTKKTVIEASLPLPCDHHLTIFVQLELSCKFCVRVISTWVFFRYPMTVNFGAVTWVKAAKGGRFKTTIWVQKHLLL